MIEVGLLQELEPVDVVEHGGQESQRRHGAHDETKSD